MWMLACARLGIAYTCTALDATDAALLHRLADFAPSLCVVSPDDELLGLRSHSRLAALATTAGEATRRPKAPPSRDQ